jgi:hypothetical protein
MSASNNQIQIASYSFPHEANIAKASLEAAGIPASIADEHTINMDWLYSNALGGVRLFVPVEYEEEANVLIEQDFSHIVDEEFEASLKEATEEKSICPTCGGDELEPYTIGKKPAFIVFLLLGFPLFFYKNGNKCLSCGEISKA